MSEHVFVGFGFGPIQGGLFVAEAFKSGNFSRIVIAEIDQDLVDSVRANNGTYFINVASNNGIETQKIDHIEMLNPTVEADRKKLILALGQSTDIVTSLPSVKFYDQGEHSVASLIGQGLANQTSNATLIYTAENNNHAAERLEEAVTTYSGTLNNVQFLNTVIGKMSQVVNDPIEMRTIGLTPICSNLNRAFLVEAFNNILVSACHLENHNPGIDVFGEKEDLLPFEEVKLFGHNAIHALMGYLGSRRGYKKMSELKKDTEIMTIARQALLNESGTALIKKYAYLNDNLFTNEGFENYADDLLQRIVNPYLQDSVERASRDPLRKLGLTDRLFGTMQLVLDQHIEPTNIALGAAAGLAYVMRHRYTCNGRNDLRNSWPVTNKEDVANLLLSIWNKKPDKHFDQLCHQVYLAIKLLP